MATNEITTAPVLFNCSNVKNEPPMFCKRFIIVGDDISKVLSINLTKSPVGLTFIGDNTPSTVFPRNGIGVNCGLDALTIIGTTIKFEFTQAPVSGQRVEVEVEFYYSGENPDDTKETNSSSE